MRNDLSTLPFALAAVFLGSFDAGELIRISTPSYSREIVLTASHHNQQKVQVEFAKWDNYQTTDYADIGDNESDPFLAKMINLGFVEHGASGFYHADGSPIEQLHAH